MYRGVGKRAVDAVVSAALLVVLSPLLLVTAILVRLRLGSPVLFRQTRPGVGGTPFRIAKFRTMTSATDRDGNLLPDDQRLTGFGSWLRSTSLDELPELWNVLKGDMSLVGPRPLLTAYLDRYTPEQARRHEVRPGITGWAQVNGRNNAGWAGKLQMDVWYVENVSFPLDARILWRTLWSVVKREDVAENGHATATEFLGTERPA